MLSASDALSAEERAAVGAAVRDAEARTSGEIVPVLATMSSVYPRAKDRAGMLGALLVMVAAWLVWPGRGGSWADAEPPLLAVLGLLGGGFLLFRGTSCLSPAFRRLFILPGERREEVERGAAEAFSLFRVHGTRGGTGVVIYVSLYEGLVAVLGDRAIAGRLPSADWEAMRRAVVDGIRAGDPAAGLAEGIRRAGALLAEHFPRDPDDVNELANELRILDG